MKKLTPENIKSASELIFVCGSLNKKITIREWLQKLLITLLEEGESFSGKRPFGDSGWEIDPAAVLVQHGFVDGTIEKDGKHIYSDDYDEEQVQSYLKAIVLMLRVP